MQHVKKLTAFSAIMASALLVGCKTLPQPSQSDNSLVMAPYEADAKSKANGFLITRYILNSDPKLYITADPASGSDGFSFTNGLAAGEYQVTGYRFDTISRLGMQAGEGVKVKPFKKPIPLHIEPGKVLIFPLTAVYTSKEDKNSHTVMTYVDLEVQSNAEHAELIKQAKGMKNAEMWDSFQ